MSQAEPPEPLAVVSEGEPVRSLTSKLVRFPIVGALSSAVYAASTWFYIARLGLGSSAATFAGYATAIPFSFFAHRSFTFGSRGAVGVEIKRFALVHAAGMLVAWLSMRASQVLGLHYAVGIVTAVLLVPLVSFVVLNRWVFRTNARPLPGR
ncbi:MAG: GtrA family protein [Dokdonella sp.]